MANTFNALTSGSGGIATTGDSSGSFAFQKDGVNKVTISDTGVIGATAITGLTTALSTAQGGTGLTAAGTSGNALVSDGTNWTSGKQTITSGTAVASTSGTSIDFTGIPSWVKRITVMFNGVSTSGTSKYLLQLGSGSVETSGYLGSSNSLGATANSGEASSTSGLTIARAPVAADSYSAVISIVNISGNVWSISSSLYDLNASNSTIFLSGGTKTTSGTLDRVRITTANGTDTFDAGTINIIYE